MNHRFKFLSILAALILFTACTSIFIYKKTSMDLNKKHLLYLTVFFLFLSLNASGQSNSISGREYLIKTQKNLLNTPVLFYSSRIPYS